MRKKKLQTFFDYAKFYKNARRIFRQAFHKSRPSRGFLKERVMKMTTVSSLWPRRDCATSQSSNVLARVGLVALAIVSVAILFTACGGGGGGGTTTTTPPVVVAPPEQPPVTPPVTPPVAKKLGVLTVSPCVVEAGKNSCQASATATQLENVTTTSFQVPGASVPGPGPVTVMAPLGTVTVVLTGDGEKLDEKSFTVDCATGLVLQGITCMKPTVTGTLSVPQATVANDTSTATVVVSFTSNHTSALTVTLGSETKTVPSGSGDATFVRTGTNDLPVSLKDNGVEIASGVSKASCNSGAAWDTTLKLPGREAGQCTKILCYTEKVSALMGVAATVYAVDVALAPNGAKIAKDLTGWTVDNGKGYIPPPAKVAWNKINNPDAFGRVHGLATDSATLTYRKVYWDPVANTINPYGPGTVAPADFNDDYYDVVTVPNQVWGWVPFTEVVGGWYFTYSGDGGPSQFDIWYQAKGEPKPAPVLVQSNLREFGGNTNIKFLSTWTHTCVATQ